MPTHRCDYCLKPISTLAGVKQHIAQSAACQQQWNWEWNRALEHMASTTSVDNEDQIDDDLDNAPGVTSNGYDGDNLNIPDGPLVQWLWTYAKADPLHPPSRHALVEDDFEDESALAKGGRFIEQYMEVATQILGSRPMVFEDMEKAENASSGSQWAPFHNEEEWELAHFLMKNVGQTKIDDFLKLSLVWTLTGLVGKKTLIHFKVCQSGVSFTNTHAFLKYVDSL
ncbi:hypothetical protein PISMIDRAFT_18051 [Pisolithus microcarpus 441]|uniref:Uncharacterized protein n=1 Tax=Pisolithus microcarpus 441 TaxID=765257 RepID=A0A0C9YZV6_9AGAM|nr:hypothetical protein BKA83DRAFT_18051 [Pisolithus microcarpus]KIK13353.1 hypothetical protein PISMIDRAFT_18051 [Pisolithus microcarpus 441]